MQPVLLKVYGNLAPASEKLFEALDQICHDAMPQEQVGPIVSLEENLLRISFEGIYFPVDETLEAIKIYGQENQQGKLDILDMENWRLTRYIFNDNQTTSHSAPLNNILDYSGH